MNKQQEKDVKRCEKMAEKGKDMDCMSYSCNVCIAQEPDISLREKIEIDTNKEPDIVERLQKVYCELEWEKERELTAEEKELIKTGYHAALLDTSYDMAIGSKGVFRKV